MRFEVELILKPNYQLVPLFLTSYLMPHTSYLKMKGYLLKEQQITIGEDTFIKSVSSENNFAVIFEDDNETGYFYGAEEDKETQDVRILDMVHIYDVESIPEMEREATLSIIWSTDWTRCALVLNNYCHAVFDFANQAGYNRNRFPPPHIWTSHDRALTDEMIASFFK